MSGRLLSANSAHDFATSPEDFITRRLQDKLGLSSSTTARTSRAPPRADESRTKSKRFRPSGHGLNQERQIESSSQSSQVIPQSRVKLFEYLKLILKFLLQIPYKLYKLLGLPILFLLMIIFCTYYYCCSIPVVSLFSTCPILQSPPRVQQPFDTPSFDTPIVKALQDTAQSFQSVYLEPPDPKARQTMEEVAAAFYDTSHRTRGWVEESSQIIRHMEFEMDDVTERLKSIDSSIWSSFKPLNNFFHQQLQRELHIKFENIRGSIRELNNTNHILVDDYIRLNKKLDNLTDELRTSHQEWSQQVGKESSKFFLRRDNERIKSLKSDLTLTGMIRSFSSSARGLITCANIFDDLSVILTLLDKTLRTSKDTKSSQQQQVKEAQFHLRRFHELTIQKDGCLINALKDITLDLGNIKASKTAEHEGDLSSHSGNTRATMFSYDVLPNFVQFGYLVTQRYWTQNHTDGVSNGIRSLISSKWVAEGLWKMCKFSMKD